MAAAMAPIDVELRVDTRKFRHDMRRMARGPRWIVVLSMATTIINVAIMITLTVIR